MSQISLTAFFLKVLQAHVPVASKLGDRVADGPLQGMSSFDVTVRNRGCILRRVDRGSTSSSTSLFAVESLTLAFFVVS
jgi:hypothetical protein